MTANMTREEIYEYISEACSKPSHKLTNVAKLAAVTLIARRKCEKVPRDALIIGDGESEEIFDGWRILVVSPEPLCVGSGTVFLLERDKLVGIVGLEFDRKLDLESFRDRALEHLITEEERRKRWPGVVEFFCYRVFPIHSFSSKFDCSNLVPRGDIPRIVREFGDSLLG